MTSCKSASGQKRTSTALLRVSALGPAADVKAVALARPLCTQNRKSASEFDVLSAMPILRSHAFAAAPLPKVADVPTMCHFIIITAAYGAASEEPLHDVATR